MTEEQRQYNGEKLASSTNSAGKTRHSHAKNNSRHRPYTLDKN